MANTSESYAFREYPVLPAAWGDLKPDQQARYSHFKNYALPPREDPDFENSLQNLDLQEFTFNNNQTQGGRFIVYEHETFRRKDDLSGDVLQWYVSRFARAE